MPQPVPRTAKASRSVALFGALTFVELYWIRHLPAGRIADRIVMVRTVQLGSALTVPSPVALRLVPGAVAPLVTVLFAGVAPNIPWWRSVRVCR
ncbi:hypothetical protein [Streptomyces sp. NPDC050264]|uniref:hypothetical protein n=1 Tax=Streptomyces sp. NPDC050264 TaxID=3155038 RepID=UPI00342C5B04